MYLDNFTWQIPTKIYFGNGEAERIPAIVKQLKASRILIVCDLGIKKTGIVDNIKDKLVSVNCVVNIFAKVEFNPTVEIVEEGFSMAKNMDCDLIIGVGGGSSIDTAKAISILMTNKKDIKYYWKKPIKNNPLFLIAIPTTSGTASEITRFTVIKDKTKKVKMGIGDARISPKIAICDPKLTTSMPKEITAATGLDALTHAIESYTNMVADPISKLIAGYAIKLIGENLCPAYANGNNLEARYNMLLGSLLAGIAFNNTNLGIVHAITSPMGGYFDVPHGVINAILLPYVMEFNLIGNLTAFAKIAELLGENITSLSATEAAQKAVIAVKDILKKVEIDFGLKNIGVKDENLEEICKEAMQNRNIQINPRTPTLENLIAICRIAM